MTSCHIASLSLLCTCTPLSVHGHTRVAPGRSFPLPASVVANWAESQSRPPLNWGEEIRPFPMVVFLGRALGVGIYTPDLAEDVEIPKREGFWLCLCWMLAQPPSHPGQQQQHRPNVTSSACPGASCPTGWFCMHPPSWSPPSSD